MAAINLAANEQVLDRHRPRLSPAPAAQDLPRIASPMPRGARAGFARGWRASKANSKLCPRLGNAAGSVFGAAAQGAKGDRPVKQYPPIVMAFFGLALVVAV